MKKNGTINSLYYFEKKYNALCPKFEYEFPH